MGDVAAYVLAVAIGLAGGTFAAVRFYRGNPEIRDTPPALLRRGLIATGLAAAAFAFLAWALGEWNGVYLAGGATFGAVLFVSYYIWPLVRERRNPRKLG